MKKSELLSEIKKNIQQYCDEHYHFGFNPENPSVKLHEPTFAADEIYAATETFLSTQVTMGKKTREFESAYCQLLQYSYGVMNNSGSSANLLALAALTNPVTQDHLRPGDEVIVPALAWSTSVWPIVQMGLIPVFVDSDPATFNIDPQKIEAAISNKTRAILIIHVYGNPCDMDSIMTIAQKHKLQVIEDCCEAMGATYKDTSVGSFGRMGTFSFYFSHHITTLEGGICVTDDYELSETLRVLRAHGWSREAEQHAKYVDMYPTIDPRFIFINVGYNLRVTELQAVIGLQQLTKLKTFVKNRQKTAAFYTAYLKKYDAYFDFQHVTPNATSSWFGFSVIVKENAPFTVKEITHYLQSKGIETRPIIAGNITKHPAMHMYPHRIAGNLAVADRIMQRGFAFGNHQHIDEAARAYVVEHIAQFMNEKMKAVHI